MKRYDWISDSSGCIVRRPKDLLRLLCVGFLRLANLVSTCGKYDMPSLSCELEEPPDYIALYDHPSEYTRTDKTAVAFYLYDEVFDGQNGLYNAIKYCNQKQLSEFKERFSEVRCIISPDISLFGDFHVIEGLHRIFRARIISLWFAFEIGCAVIPHIPLITRPYLRHAIDGLEGCKMVAFSTKGYIRQPLERIALIKTVQYVVDRVKPRVIVVYDTCGSNTEAQKLFRYATDRDIKVVVVPNGLKERNIAKALDKGACK